MAVETAPRTSVWLLATAVASGVVATVACSRSNRSDEQETQPLAECTGPGKKVIADLREPETRAYVRNDCTLELTRVAIAGIDCGDRGRVIVHDSALVSPQSFAIVARQTCDITLVGTRVASDGWAIDLSDGATITLKDVEIVGLISGQHDYLDRIRGLDHAKWTAPGELERQSLTASRCLSTTGLRAAQAIGWRRQWKLDPSADRGATAPRLHPDDVAWCVAEMATVGRPPTPLTSAGRRWASAINSLAATYTRERTHYTQGDDRDDPARGPAIGAEIERAEAELGAAAGELRRALAPSRPAAWKVWLATAPAGNPIAPRVYALLAATDDVVYAAGDAAAPGGIEPALDQFAARCIEYDDLLAAQPGLRSSVDSFWAYESGNATTWSALESALGDLCGHGKQVRRRLRDDRVRPTLDDLVGLTLRYESAYSHFSRLRFNTPR